MSDEGGMQPGEIIRLVNEYIGVNEGYLGDFSYRTHEEFYPVYCDLEIDPSKIQGQLVSVLFTFWKQPNLETKYE